MVTNEIKIEDDFAFHLAVAQATGNRFFEAAVRRSRPYIAAGMSITRNFALLRTREELLALQAEHRAIFEAIDAKRPEEARDAMRAHLHNAMRRAFHGTL
jgi:DNA-binding FadR family transcriptional regulator